MAVKKRAVRKTKVEVRKPSLKDEIVSAEIAINDRFLINELEHRCLLLEKEYNDLKQRLVDLLLPEQVDAAKTCGVTPEVYALEWIGLHKDKLKNQAPDYADYVRGLKTISGHSSEYYKGI